MTDWLLLQNGLIIYPALFFALLGGAVALPIPEDIPLIIGGVLVENGNADLKVTFVVCYLAIILGDLIIYSLGRFFGAKLFEKGWVKARFPARRIKKVKLNLEKRSLLMIFVARHLFYLRTATFLTCGAVRMGVKQFLLADLMAALISVPLMMGIGYFAAQHYSTAMHVLSQTKTISLVVFIAVVVIYGFILWVRLKRKKSDKPED